MYGLTTKGSIILPCLANFMFAVSTTRGSQDINKKSVPTTEDAMDSYELQLFTNFVQLINSTLNFEQRIRHSIMVDGSGLESVPRVIVDNAVSYLITKGLKENRQKNKMIKKIFACNLKRSPSAAGTKNIEFQFKIDNIDNEDLEVYAVKLAFSNWISSSNRNNQLLDCQIYTKYSGINVYFHDDDSFNRVITLAVDKERGHLISERLKPTDKNFKIPGKSTITVQVSMVNADKVLFSKEKCQVIVQLEIPTTKSESLSTIFRQQYRKSRSSGTGDIRYSNGFHEKRSYPLKIFQDGCALKTYTWNFQDPVIKSVLDRSRFLRRVFKENGEPVGSYHMSFCVATENSKCMATNTGEPVVNDPHLDNEATMYLQQYMQTNLNLQGYSTGCCFADRLKDVAITFNDNRVQYIKNAVAESCRCYYGG
ncbi:hypothetical protein GJ496_011108 [Pomphorhynchus laevis]|nr:hypothetical protein GJ496_011108 [Pomphorhynchus laevis]